MSGVPRWLLRRAGADVVIEPYQGAAAWGPLYGAPVTVRAIVDSKRQLVRNEAGDEVVSSTTLLCPLGTVAPAGSRVTLPDGTAPTVIAAHTHDGRQLPVPSHVELSLT